jgi:hypothetical protein
VTWRDTPWVRAVTLFKGTLTVMCQILMWLGSWNYSMLNTYDNFGVGGGYYVGGMALYVLTPTTYPPTHPHPLHPTPPPPTPPHHHPTQPIPSSPVECVIACLGGSIAPKSRVSQCNACNARQVRIAGDGTLQVVHCSILDRVARPKCSPSLKVPVIHCHTHTHIHTYTHTHTHTPRGKFPSQ